MKPSRIVWMAGVVYFAANASLSFAGIDMQKWESFVRSELQSVAQQVDKTGKAPVSRPLVKDYDTNKDNFIDTREVQAIKAYLAKTPQVQTPSVQTPVVPKSMTAQKPQVSSSYQAPVSKETKKKEWWRY